MKKILIATLVLALVLGLGACAGQAQSNETADNGALVGDADSNSPHSLTDDSIVRDNLPQNLATNVFFEVAEPTDRNVDDFWPLVALQDGGIPGFSSASYQDAAVYNYAPAYISEQYGVDIFRLEKEGQPSPVFARYKDTLFYVSYHAAGVDSPGLISFALSDGNGDGYFEIYTSTNKRYVADNPNAASMCTTTVCVSDTKTRKCFQRYEYNGYVYFKENANGHVCAYKTDEDSYEGGTYEQANTLLDDFEPNTSYYAFAGDTFTVECDLFRATVTIQNYSLGFPVHYTDWFDTIYFEVIVTTTYLGEPFDYSGGSIRGASVKFFNAQSTLDCEPWAEAAVIVRQTINPGDVFSFSYRYCDRRYASQAKPQDTGTYDMEISYRGQTVLVEDVLTLTRG